MDTNFQVPWKRSYSFFAASSWPAAADERAATAMTQSTQVLTVGPPLDRSGANEWEEGGRNGPANQGWLRGAALPPSPPLGGRGENPGERVETAIARAGLFL